MRALILINSNRQDVAVAASEFLVVNLDHDENEHIDWHYVIDISRVYLFDIDCYICYFLLYCQGSKSENS